MPGNIIVSGGDILINEQYFSTKDYDIPHYPRSISYEDTAISSGGLVIARRSVTDLGPMLGIWKQFTVLCYNEDDYDMFPQKGRGQYLYEHLWHFYTGFVGIPLTLTHLQTGLRYSVMFGQEGLDIHIAQMPNQRVDGEDMGTEYECKISLFQVTA